ncbi:unnamed protein product [Leptosia nina]|uniref:Uncharacterized protein n=1 Tax=Leptosia nina TaxID=320188 RepID=A0AAV1JWP4_9NEOP
MPVTVVYRQNASAPSIFRAGRFGSICAQSAPAFTDWKRDASGVRERATSRRHRPIPPERAASARLHFRFASRFCLILLSQSTGLEPTNRMTRTHARLLGPCFKTGPASARNLEHRRHDTRTVKGYTAATKKQRRRARVRATAGARATTRIILNACVGPDVRAKIARARFVCTMAEYRPRSVGTGGQVGRRVAPREGTTAARLQVAGLRPTARTALDGVYHPLRAALSSNPTLRSVPLARSPRRYGPGTLCGKTAPFKTNLDESGTREKAEPPEHHISRDRDDRGIQRWAPPCSLAATEGILANDTKKVGGRRDIRRRAIALSAARPSDVVSAYARLSFFFIILIIVIIIIIIICDTRDRSKAARAQIDAHGASAHFAKTSTTHHVLNNHRRRRRRRPRSNCIIRRSRRRRRRRRRWRRVCVVVRCCCDVSPLPLCSALERRQSVDRDTSGGRSASREQ